MIAHFYIVADSFAHNNRITSENVEKKIKKLSEDVISIHKYRGTNKIYVNYNELYPQIFYLNYTLAEFVCEPQRLKKEGVDRDIVSAVQKILDRSNETSLTSAEVLSELMSWNDENDCHGILVFHKIEEVDENFQVIYDEGGWLKFRRHFLSVYPGNGIFFIDECIKYFPNIVFHPRNKNTIGAILRDCSGRIIYHLAALNDKFRSSQQEGLNRSQVLVHFSAANELDAVASLEGNASRKKAFTFNFTDKEGKKTIEVCCEPHLKLCFNDFYPGDNSYSTDRRIYFHEGVEGFEKGNILLGHIGSHL